MTPEEVAKLVPLHTPYPLEPGTAVGVCQHDEDDEVVRSNWADVRPPSTTPEKRAYVMKGECKIFIDMLNYCDACGQKRLDDLSMVVLVIESSPNAKG